MEIKKIKDNLEDIPKPCKTCLYWEAPTEYQEDNGDEEIISKKKEWFRDCFEEIGNCGYLVSQDGSVIGYAQFAPATQFLNVTQGSSILPSHDEDTIFLSCLFIVNSRYRGKGIGTKLLEEIIDTLKKKGFKAIETFARRGNPNCPSGPVKFYEKNGFKVKEDHPKFPLMCLELDEN